MLKTKIKQNKLKLKLEDDLINSYIEENKKITLNITKPTTQPIQPNQNKELKQKLKTTIKQKNKARYTPDKATLNEQNEQLKAFIKHPKMTTQILQLYLNAVSTDSDKQIPNPIEIFDNVDKYKKLYYNYIMQLLQTIKANNQSIEQLDKLLDNPFAHYLSKCIDCPLNPFNKQIEKS